MASVVQALVVNGVNPATSVAAAFGSNVTAGSRIVVLTASGASIALTDGMVTDSLGNTYTKDFEFASPAGDMAVYSAPSPSGGACTVTFNPATNTRHGIVIAEISGISAYAGSQENSNNANSANVATGAITPAAANGIAFALAFVNAQVTWETDYATGAVFNSTGRINGAYKVISATTSEEASGTLGGALPWNALIIRYPDAAGGTDYDLACDSGSFAIGGTAASVLAARRLTCDPGSFAVTGTAASVLTERLLSCDSGSVSVTGTAATLRAIRRLACDQGSYTVSGTAAALQSTRTLTCSGGTFSITGTAAELKYGNILTAESGTVAISGTAAALQAARMLTCSAGAFAITGTDAVLTSSGATGPAVTADYRVLIPEDDFIVQMPSDDLRVLMPSDDTIGVM